MNAKILGMLAAGLFAGPLTAHATASTCGLDENENIVCDLYESGGTTLDIDLFGINVNPGTVGTIGAAGLGEVGATYGCGEPGSSSLRRGPLPLWNRYLRLPASPRPHGWLSCLPGGDSGPGRC